MTLLNEQWSDKCFVSPGLREECTGPQELAYYC